MKKTSGMAFANILGALAFIAVAAYAFVQSLAFKQFKNVPVGPEVFPRMMAAALAISCAALLIQSLRGKAQGKAAPTLSLKSRGMRRMLLCAGVVAALIALWNVAGFWILGPLSMFAVMWLMDMREYKTMAIVSLAVVLVVWLLFWKVLNISLPLGPFEFIY